VATWKINDVEVKNLKGTRLTRVRKSFAPDSLSFSLSEDFTDAPSFEYGDVVTLKKDSTVWFVGKTNTPRTAGSGRLEGREFQALNAWHELDRTVFQQTWLMWDAVTETVIEQYKSRCILGQAANGTRQTIAQAMTEIIAYAISAGVDLQIGTIDVPGYFPYTEALDCLCGECLRTLLRWAPDAASWVDYTTTPPTIHIRPKSAQSSATINMITGGVHDYDVTPRPDMQVPVVSVKYEQIHTIDDNSYRNIIEDRYPTEAETLQPGALILTVELAGSRMSSQRQKIKVEEFPDNNPDWIVWLKEKNKWLADASISAISIVGDVVNTSEFERELLEGMVTDWMRADGKEAERCTVTMTINYTQTVDDVARTITGKIFTTNTVATDCFNKTYRKNTVEEYAEPIPTGLAERLYGALGALNHQGSVILLAAECPGTHRPGLKLNLSDGETAWATMAAMVQSVTDNIDAGMTTIDFGFAAHLTMQDYQELLRANRLRPWSQSAVERTSEDAGAGRDVEVDGIAPVQNATSADSGASGRWNGIVVYKGQIVHSAESEPAYPFVRLKTRTGVSNEEPGPMPVPFPDGEWWYEKNNSPGTINYY